MLILYLTAGILIICGLNPPFVTSKPDIDKNCKQQLENLANSISNFTRCAVNQASPFKFCRMCYEQFDDVRKDKKDIYKKGGCVSQLVESERYQIINHVYEFARKLWDESSCFGCFSSDHRDEDTIGEKWEMKQEVKDFFVKQKLVDDCFKNYTIPGKPFGNTSLTNHSMRNLTSNMHHVCKLCEPYYHDLKAVYHGLIEGVGGFEKENLLCADVMSAMNSTRHKWSSTFNCIQISYDTASVVALTCFFGFLPIIFYSAAKLHGDSNKKKSNYEAIPQISYDNE